MPTPVMDSLVGLGSIVMGFDGWSSGRGSAELGISGMGMGMTRETLRKYLDVGDV